MKATLFPIFMDVVLKNQPEGVQLGVKQVRKSLLALIDTVLIFVLNMSGCI